MPTHTTYKIAQHNEQQRSRILDDIKRHPRDTSGMYKGIEYAMYRAYGMYWCIQVLPTKKIPKTCITSINIMLGGKLTDDLRFAFSRDTDFTSLDTIDEIGELFYRNYEYALTTVYWIIDHICAASEAPKCELSTADTLKDVGLSTVSS